MTKIVLLFILGLLLIFTGFLTSSKDNTYQKHSLNTPARTYEDTSITPDNSKKTNINGKKNEIFVSKVLDGDTIETNTGEKIRYLGINTPEKGQPFANESTKLNQDLTLGKTIDLEFDVQTKDRYGRTLAYVYTNGIFVNLEIIKKGLAVSETIQPNIKYQDEIVNAQKEAREGCLGIWKGLCGNSQSDVLGQNNCVKIISINANSPGDDNKNKNGEWIEIKNECHDQTSIKDFLIKDSSASNKYIFKNFSIDGGKIVKIHSGCAADTTLDLYWKCPETKYAIWNNSGDHAFLYNEDGELISDYKY
ncbi:MAG: thermonuclease family protein [Candidatus Levybacteria bacterium]|nr:thermonuclease family protein [Candidatus Levybacteria bacterium]